MNITLFLEKMSTTTVTFSENDIRECELLLKAVQCLDRSALREALKPIIRQEKEQKEREKRLRAYARLLKRQHKEREQQLKLEKREQKKREQMAKETMTK